MSQTRQLAAIMFTDIVGYTTLMGKDEAKAFAILDKNRAIQKLIIEQYKGRWIKELGDGVMASFNSVSDAVNAAIKIQQACNAAKEIQLRVGIHQGEVVFENDDVFGDGVNIAARIQALATPGGIWVSEAVNHNLSNKIDIETEFIRTEQLKNVKEPVRIYQVKNEGLETTTPEKLVELVAEKSIAVLPFVNMSQDVEQEFFSDGISEEIINVLAQVHELKVIGRTSSFAFKGKNLDLKLIGEQLKVNYLLEGSVRKAGNKIRVTAQLIKVSDGFHLYSEKFDCELEDIFAIQDEISLAILSAIKIKLLGEEKEAILRKDTDNLEAYQLYLKGLFYFNRASPESWGKAIEYFKDAIKADPGYAVAYAGLANCYYDSYFFNWLPREQSLPQAITAARKALELDDKLAESHIAVGRIKLWHDWDFAGAAIELDKGIRLNPNSVEGLRQLGILNILMGNHQQTHTYLKKADILDPFSLLNLFYIASYYVIEKDTDKTVEYARRQIELVPDFFGGHLMVLSVYIKENRYEEWVATLELTNKLSGYGDLLSLSLLGGAYAFTGKKMKALEVLEIMKKIRGTQNMGNIQFGLLHAAMGEFAQAFDYFDKAIELHEGFTFYLKTFCQDYAPEIMKDPRFRKLIERIGIPIDQE